MDITGQAQSPDGLVRAVVDVGGMLTDLEIAPEALGLRADHLARVISSVTQEAAGRARAEVRSLYQPLIEEGLVGDLPVLLPGSLPKASATASPPPVDADEDEASFEETFSLRRTER
ncbi:YbaB/EbfC DNA-binding family protein [Actinokineospora iranica]|uniref:YbaB/EbfC DNA-binding family protein n=2 Tax=Actinokineospora iranica TaxID=1271860 RepID=A0A1G6SRX6_9PSEU|nr:YbaB/EbfC DNA-binding family protein [Actinokineospora iranica]